MTIEQELFSRYETDEKKLSDYGFSTENGKFVFKKTLSEDSFEVVIEFNGEYRGRIEDLEMGGEYTNFRLEWATGYSAEIRKKFTDLLLDIREKCCVNKLFVFEQTRRINEYICEHYKVKPEFLWDAYPSFAVYRRKDSEKWFALFGKVKKNKIDKLSESKEEVECVNLKIDYDELKKVLKRRGFFPAYHMNKKSWVTVIFDDTIADYEIKVMLENSYQSVK